MTGQTDFWKSDILWGPHEIIVRPKGDKNFVSEWGERRHRSPYCWRGQRSMRSDCRTRVVWAALCDRNFGGMLENSFEHSEIRIAFQQAASEIQKIRTYANKTRDFVIFSFTLPSFCQLYAPYLPPDSIGTSSEPDRNLIGTSPNDKRIFKQRSLSLK